MELINRYVYTVTRGLPEKQREDIEMELRTLIDDMVEQKEDGRSYEDKVKAVLLELGDPEVLTDNYRGSKRYMIGPQYYDKYIFMLKIVFAAVFAGISIAVFAGSFFSMPEDLDGIITDYFASIFSGLLQAFAWTTIVFVIAERNSVNIEGKSKRKNEWDLSQLPLIPDKKALIPRSEPIVSIIFATIFIALLYSVPEVFAAYINRGNGTTVIPVLNSEAIAGYRVLILCIYAVGVLKEVLKLYFRRWTLKLSVILAALSIASTVLALAVFTNNNVWNPNFSSELVTHMNLTFDFVSIWERLKDGFIAVIVFAGIIEIITGLYKGVRYNITK